MSSYHDKISGVVGSIRRVKIILYVILFIATVFSLFYLYMLNIEVGLANIISNLWRIDTTYFAISILTIGIIVPFIVGIYIIAYHISNLSSKIGSVVNIINQFETLSNKVEKIIYDIHDIKELYNIMVRDIEVYYKEILSELRSVSAVASEEDVSQDMEETTTVSEEEIVKEDSATEEYESVESVDENVGVLRSMADSLDIIRRELDKLRKKLF